MVLPSLGTGSNGDGGAQLERRDSEKPSSAALPAATLEALMPGKRCREGHPGPTQREIIRRVEQLSRHEMQGLLVRLSQVSTSVRQAILTHHDVSRQARSVLPCLEQECTAPLHFKVYVCISSGEQLRSRNLPSLCALRAASMQDAAKPAVSRQACSLCGRIQLSPEQELSSSSNTLSRS
jgi:hypothetical protein